MSSELIIAQLTNSIVCELLDALKPPVRYTELVRIAYSIIERDGELEDSSVDSSEDNSEDNSVEDDNISELSGSNAPLDVVQTINAAVHTALAAQEEKTARANSARAVKGAITRAAKIKLVNDAAAEIASEIAMRDVKAASRAVKCSTTPQQQLPVHVPVQPNLFAASEQPNLFAASAQPNIFTMDPITSTSPFSFGQMAPMNFSSLPTTPITVKLPPAKPDYATFTVRDLNSIARARGIRGFSKMKKCELIEALTS